MPIKKAINKAVSSVKAQASAPAKPRGGFAELGHGPSGAGGAGFADSSAKIGYGGTVSPPLRRPFIVENNDYSNLPV